MMDGERRRPWKSTLASSGPVAARANMPTGGMAEVLRLRLHISIRWLTEHDIAVPGDGSGKWTACDHGRPLCAGSRAVLEATWMEDRVSRRR
jgi:hypothetical protein